MDTENLRPMIPTRKGRYRLYKSMASEDGLQLCGSNAWLVSGHWKRHSGSAFADDELRVADPPQPKFRSVGTPLRATRLVARPQSPADKSDVPG